MNIFTWLVLGHLVGDWVLQNDWMAKGKRQGLVTGAGMVHFIVYTVTCLVAAWLAGVQRQNAALYLGLALFIFVTHWLTDATDIVDFWMRSYRQTNIPMVRMMVDQSFHLIILGGLAAWLAAL